MKKTIPVTQELLEFWYYGSYKNWDRHSSVNPAVMKKWFVSDKDFDATVTKKYGAYLTQLEEDKLPEEWMQGPDGFHAYIVLADQLSRNIHRGSGKAFQNDGKARDLAIKIVNDKELWAKYNNAEKHMILCPLMHSENAEDGELGVKLAEELVEANKDSEMMSGYFKKIIGS